jgi:hypothetical protein
MYNLSDDHPAIPTVARLHPPGVAHCVTLDRALQGRIGAELRALYGELIHQPIPDRLLALVDRIAKFDREKPDEC